MPEYEPTLIARCDAPQGDGWGAPEIPLDPNLSRDDVIDAARSLCVISGNHVTVEQYFPDEDVYRHIVQVTPTYRVEPEGG